MGQSDQSTVPLGPSLSEGTAEQQVETEPANQATDHLQYWHGCLDETIGLISPSYILTGRYKCLMISESTKAISLS